MLPAVVVAQYFVKKGVIENKPLTQMKLQKMVYFAQGYHLAIYDKPLISEPIEAWKFGPVVPQLYQRYKLWGNQEINTLSGLPFNTYETYTSSVSELGREFSEEEKQTLDFTWEVTKNVDAYSLSNWSHEAGAPWDKAISARADYIDPNEIKRYFKLKLLANEPA